MKYSGGEFSRQEEKIIKVMTVLIFQKNVIILSYKPNESL